MAIARRPLGKRADSDQAEQRSTAKERLTGKSSPPAATNACRVSVVAAAKLANLPSGVRSDRQGRSTDRATISQADAAKLATRRQSIPSSALGEASSHGVRTPSLGDMAFHCPLARVSARSFRPLLRWRLAVALLRAEHRGWGENRENKAKNYTHHRR